jgi:hypothetical protein
MSDGTTVVTTQKVHPTILNKVQVFVPYSGTAVTCDDYRKYIDSNKTAGLYTDEELVAKCGVYMSNEYKAMMLAVMTAN